MTPHQTTPGLSERDRALIEAELGDALWTPVHMAEAFMLSATQLGRLLDAARKEPSADWRPIDSAPKDGNDVLLWFAGSPGGFNGFVDLCFYGSGQWVVSGEGEGRYSRNQSYYTHWMPLPAAPTPPPGEQE